MTIPAISAITAVKYFVTFVCGKALRGDVYGKAGGTYCRV